MKSGYKLIKTGLLLLCALFLFGYGWETRAADPQYRALLVTRGDYAKTSNDLSSGPENDGEDVRRMLTNAYQDTGISVSVNTEVKNQEALKAAVQEAFADSTAEDINYFYYVGHGLQDGLYLEIGSPVVTAELLLDCFEGISGTNVLIMDCCYAGIFNENTVQSRSVTAEKAYETFADEFVQDFTDALGKRPQIHSVLNNSRFRLLLSASAEEVSN